MNVPLRATLSLLTVLLPITSADAQPYVGVSFLADVIRASGPNDQPSSGEALGGALRVGARLGEKWGVDVEFGRSGDVEWQSDVGILAGLTQLVPGVIGVLPDISIFPPPEISVEAHLATLTTMLWWRQRVTERLDLVYLGGAAFTRTVAENRVSYGGILPPLRGLPSPLPRVFEHETVGYDTGVAVGLDGSIEMTDHLRLVPGLRLLTVTSRWIVRPSAGLQWRF